MPPPPPPPPIDRQFKENPCQIGLSIILVMIRAIIIPGNSIIQAICWGQPGPQKTRLASDTPGLIIIHIAISFEVLDKHE